MKTATMLFPRDKYLIVISAGYNLGVTYLKIKNRKEAIKEYKALKGFDDGTADALIKEIRAAS